MKNSLKINKNIWRASTMILIAVFVFASVVAVSPAYAEKSVSQAAISSYLAAQVNPALSDEQKIKAAIDAYFTTRYEGQKHLQTQNFSAVLSDVTQSWVKTEMDKREIELHIARRFDLQYISYKYTLGYGAINIKNKIATVQLYESHDVVFKALAPYGVVSKLGRLQHTFTLQKVKNAWAIRGDQYQDELSEQMVGRSRNEMMTQVDANYQEEVQRKASQGIVQPLALIPTRTRTSTPVPTRTRTPMPTATRTPGLVVYPYNRAKAAAYADKYWNTANPPYYKGMTETDCTNYVSQAIYAGQGKIPPDTSGMKQEPFSNTDWFYHWNNTGSDSWSGVTQQYTFITGNTNRIGPFGAQVASYCNTDIGDVVQLYDGTKWYHEGIISVILNRCTGMALYLVNAHTVNRFHYPLINWTAPSNSTNMRYLHISGWRGK